MRFRTTIVQGDKTAMGIRVPDEVIAALGPSRRPPVRVTVNGYTYRTTVAVMNGAFMFGVSADVRRNAGLKTRQRRIPEAVRMLKEGRKQR